MAYNVSRIPEAEKRFEGVGLGGVRSCGVICCDSFVIIQRRKGTSSLFFS